jgi:hypothetical protein
MVQNQPKTTAKNIDSFEEAIINELGGEEIS